MGILFVAHSVSTFLMFGLCLFSKCAIHLLFAALDLCCCTRHFSSCSEQGLLSNCSVQASHCGGFSCCGAQAVDNRLSSCVSLAWLPSSTWKLLRPGIKPLSSELAGGFLATGSPGKSLFRLFI